MGDDLLTIQEIAERLRLAESTVYAMAAERELPAFKVRGQWRVRRSDFEGWLNAVSRAEPARDSDPEAAEPACPISEFDPVSRVPAGEIVAPLPLGRLTERLTQADLHRRFVESLGPGVRPRSILGQKPLDLDLTPPLPTRARVYLFNATRPPGGRPLGEHKVQLILPGQRRGERGSFDHGDGRLVFLAGYAAEEDVFVFWDAGLYGTFAWSRNVQVKAETIIEASAGRLAVQHRHLRQPGIGPTLEVVLAAPASRLREALQRRVEITRERMLRD